MAFKYVLYWRGYEASYFKPHGREYLFALPYFFGKTYLVTSEQREELRKQLRRISTIETYARLVFLCAVLALLASILFLGIGGTMLVFGSLGIVVLGLAVPNIGLVLRFFLVRSVSKGLQQVEEKFTRADWNRNCVASMSRSRFKFRLAMHALLTSLILLASVFIVFEIAESNPTNIYTGFESRRTIHLILLAALCAGFVVFAGETWKLIRLRRLGAPGDWSEKSAEA